MIDIRQFPADHPARQAHPLPMEAHALVLGVSKPVELVRPYEGALR